jgi:pyruvate/2-oxoglutarate dehydrogenase complex dihydrolipoamide dehydrogenase (E3) component
MSTRASFDAIVVGTGQAGPALAARLAGAGWKVAIVEKDKFGGTCVNNGCTPTKAMVASAYAAHIARRAAEYGVMVETAPRIDYEARQGAQGRDRPQLEPGRREMAVEPDGVTVYRGHARFVGRTELQVGSQTLHAEKIFVNVGGRPLKPNMPGIDTVRTSRTRR